MIKVLAIILNLSYIYALDVAAIIRDNKENDQQKRQLELRQVGDTMCLSQHTIPGISSEDQDKH